MRISKNVLPAGYRRVLAAPAVRPLMLAFLTSSLGDGMSVVAVAWLAIQITGASHRGAVVGLAVAATTLPGAVGLFFGWLLRGRSSTWLLAADSSLRAVMLGALPLVRLTGVLHPTLYVGLLAASSLLHAWGVAARYTLLAELLPPQDRLAGNAMVASLSSLSYVLGPALAGVLVGIVDPSWILGIDALSFVALAVVAGRTTRSVVRLPADSPAPAGQRLATLQLRDRPTLMAVIGLTWVFNLLYGPVEVALPVHVSDQGPGAAELLGIYWASFGVGAIIGSIAAGWLGRLPLWPTLLGIVAGWGAILLPFGLHLPTAVTVVSFAVGGVIYGPFNPVSTSLFQQLTPASQLAPVLALEGSIGLVAAPVGTAIGGPLTTAFGASTVLGASGAATILLAVVAGAVKLGIGRGRPHHDPPQRTS